MYNFPHLELVLPEATHKSSMCGPKDCPHVFSNCGCNSLLGITTYLKTKMLDCILISLQGTRSAAITAGTQQVHACNALHWSCVRLPKHIHLPSHVLQDTVTFMI